MNANIFLEKAQKYQKIPTSLLLYSKSKSMLDKISLSYAKGILCQNKTPWGCGECYSCKIFYEKHPDFIWIGKDGNIKIDDIREISSFSSLRPNYSTYKVCYISNAQNMLRESSNAMLKILEEPPIYLKFIITADSLANIIPTIISRSMVLEIFAKEDIKDNPLCDELFSKHFYEFVLKVDEIKDIDQKKDLVDCLISKLQKFMLNKNTFDKDIEEVINRLTFTKNALKKGIRLSLWLLEDLSFLIDKLF